MDEDPVKKMLLEDSDSDEELTLLTTTIWARMHFNRKGESISRRGSIPGRRFIDRDSLQGHQRLFLDYFADSPVYPPKVFRRRFRMHRPLFCRILSAIEVYDPYFVQKRNCAGTIGLSSLQKMTAAFRMLAYGVPADYVDEYVRIGEATAIISLQKFVNAVVSIYSDNYLRSPNSEDVARLLEVGESRGFPGMLGSIDCMHWQWKNCPAAWKGIFTGHQHEPTMILEAVASQDLWIWHAFFGLPGSHNDINVLDRSSVFSDLAQGRAPPANYSVNGHNYTMGYYLADGIYPQWSTFVKTISCPQGKKAKLFAAAQESTRKDVERAFGVLQARFAIIRGPARGWNRETLINIMKACIILHNMIIEYERNTDDNIDFEYEQIDETPHVQISRDHTPGFAEFIQRHLSIRDRQTHSQLQSDLIEHLWQFTAGTGTTPVTTTPSTTPSTTTPSTTTPSTTTPSTTTTPTTVTPTTTSPYTATPSNGVLGGIGSGVGPSGAGINSDDSHGGLRLLDTTFFSFFMTLSFTALMLWWG